MKKIGVILFVLVFFLTGSSLLWAGGSDNKTNWSAEYIGILNRNAATDAADIVMYNPAGVMKMENGLYGNLSAHYILKDYNNKINGTDFDQDEPSVVPGLFTVYKEDKWAGFFAVSNVIGGGKVDFEDGNVTTTSAGVAIINGANFALAESPISGLLLPANFYSGISSQNLKAEAMGIGFTLGGAYEINDMWSVSLGVRYVKSTREMEGSITVAAATPLDAPYTVYNAPITADVAFEEEADGFGGIIGINFSPSDALNIGVHYDTKIDLDYEADVATDTVGILPLMGIVDGAERNRNLPAVLAAGVSYKINPKIRVESNLTLYLNENADFEGSAVDNGYEIGIGVDYAVTDTLNDTFGYLYTDSGVDKAEDMTPELPELNAHTLGAGLRYQMNDKLKLTFGLGHVFYDDASFVSGTTSITYEKAVSFVAFGMEYKFF